MDRYNDPRSVQRSGRGSGATIRQRLGEARNQWRLMTFYERFEQVVASALAGVMALVVLVALWNLLGHIFNLVGNAALDPQNHRVFQQVFSGILTLLIALEFNHSILRWAVREERIIQVKTVLVIGILALSRKFILLDLEFTSASHVFGLATAILALGGVYWLMGERDDQFPASDKKKRREVGTYRGDETWLSNRGMPPSRAGEAAREASKLGY